MKMYIFCMILCASLFGCASNKPNKVETVVVYKPVYTPPEGIKQLKVVDRPDVSSNYLSEQDKKDPGKVAKVLLETIAQMRVYVEQLEENEHACRAMLTPPSKVVPAEKHK